jgi:hypothetical protein
MILLLSKPASQFERRNRNLRDRTLLLKNAVIEFKQRAKNREMSSSDKEIFEAAAIRLDKALHVSIDLGVALKNSDFLIGELDENAWSIRRGADSRGRRRNGSHKCGIRGALWSSATVEAHTV